MSPADDSSIIAVNQIKKKVLSFVRGASLAIADARVPVDLMVIDAPRAALLVGTDWLRRYSADLLFSKKRLVFESRGQKFSTPIEYNQPIGSPNHKPEEYEVNTAEWEYNDNGIRKVWSPADQCWHHCIDDIVRQWSLTEPETAIEKALGRRIGEPKTVQEIVNIMKELQEKGHLSTIIPQYEDIDLGWEDEMEIEEDNLLTTYNLAEAISNNMMVEAIQEGPNHPDFKAVLEEFKDIQFENMKELGRTNIIQHTIQLLDERP